MLRRPSSRCGEKAVGLVVDVPRTAGLLGLEPPGKQRLARSEIANQDQPREPVAQTFEAIEEIGDRRLRMSSMRALASPIPAAIVSNGATTMQTSKSPRRRNESGCVASAK